MGGVDGLSQPPFWAVSVGLLSPKVLVLLHGLLGCFLVVGWYSRASCFASAVLLTVFRVYIVEHGGDQLLRLFTVWLCTLPLGRVWAVDARFTHSSRRRILAPGSVAVYVQIILVYLGTGLLKQG